MVTGSNRTVFHPNESDLGSKNENYYCKKAERILPTASIETKFKICIKCIKQHNLAGLLCVVSTVSLEVSIPAC